MRLAWAKLDELAPNTITPPGYTYHALRRDDIAELCRLIKLWHPDMQVGSGSHYVDPDFYENHVALDGVGNKENIVYVGTFEGDIVSAMALQIHADAMTLYSRFGVCAPAHRGTGVTLFAGYVIDALASKMGIKMVYAHITLKNRAMQQMSERAGMRPVGILPFSDIEYNADGAPQYVAEAIYVKTYDNLSQLTPIDAANMTPALKKIWAASLFNPEN